MSSFDSETWEISESKLQVSFLLTFRLHLSHAFPSTHFHLEQANALVKIHVHPCYNARVKFNKQMQDFRLGFRWHLSHAFTSTDFDMGQANALVKIHVHPC